MRTLRAGETTQSSSWNCLPNDLFAIIVTHFGEILPQPSIWSIRRVCSQWRALAANCVVALSTLGKSYSWQQSTDRNVSRVLQHFQHVRLIDWLPLKYMPSLPASLSTTLVTLTLTGTGSVALYEAGLPPLVVLRSCTFDETVTMTEALLKVLGCLPKLEHLAFSQVLFPRTPYQQCCLENKPFMQLRRLEILHKAPSTSNGSASGQAGQQFLLSLPQVQHIRFHVDAVSQVLLAALDKLPVLEFVEAVFDSFVSNEAWNQWAFWSQGSRVRFRFVERRRRCFTAADIAA